VSRRLDVFQRPHQCRPGHHSCSSNAAFAAAGFEHCIANAYFIPMGMFIKAAAQASFWKTINSQQGGFRFSRPDLELFFNLVPVTAANIIGGSLVVAAVLLVRLSRRKPIDS
jgi:formate transporter